MNVVRRAKRSTTEDATSPAAPAANVYEETISPNWAGEMPSVRINCGPSGMTIMKSTIVVNWTAARMNSTSRSRRDWRLEFASRASCVIGLPAPAPLRRVTFKFTAASGERQPAAACGSPPPVGCNAREHSNSRFNSLDNA